MIGCGKARESEDRKENRGETVQNLDGGRNHHQDLCVVFASVSVVGGMTSDLG